jgi:hypothetical protein
VIATLRLALRSAAFAVMLALASAYYQPGEGHSKGESHESTDGDHIPRPTG